MPRIPSEDEEDALAAAEDDRAETYDELEGRRSSADGRSPLEPRHRVVEHDDRALRTAAGARPHMIEEPGRVASIDDLSPAAREALRKAREYQRAARQRELEEDEQIERGEDEPTTAPAAAPTESAQTAAPAAPAAPEAAAQPPAPVPAPDPAAAQPSPTEPELPRLDERAVKAWEAINAERAAFEQQRKQWEETVGAQQKKLEAIVERFDWDPVGALRELAALKLGTDDDTKLRPVLDELYDDLTGHRLGIEADDGKKAKREARRSRAELERYQREQRAEAERAKREAEAERTRVAAEREAQQIQTWLSGTPTTSYAWLRTHEHASTLVRDVQQEFARHGQQVTVEQAAAFADSQLKEYAQAHFNRFKHLLAPDPAPAAPAAAAPGPGAVPAQAPTQPATPPSAPSQRTRTLTNTATATTPTKPPAPPKNFDPNEDPEDARMRSLARWKARQKAQQQQRDQ